VIKNHWSCINRMILIGNGFFLGGGLSDSDLVDPAAGVPLFTASLLPRISIVSTVALSLAAASAIMNISLFASCHEIWYFQAFQDAFAGKVDQTTSQGEIPRDVTRSLERNQETSTRTNVSYIPMLFLNAKAATSVHEHRAQGRTSHWPCTL
jgi:hypothetical protein